MTKAKIRTGKQPLSAMALTSARLTRQCLQMLILAMRCLHHLRDPTTTIDGFKAKWHQHKAYGLMIIQTPMPRTMLRGHNRTLDPFMALANKMLSFHGHVRPEVT